MTRLNLRLFTQIALVMYLTFTAHSVLATAPERLNPCFSAIHRVGQQFSVPEDLLVGVALTETGTKSANGNREPWPWSANVEGKGYRFNSRAEAISFVEKQRRAGIRSIDVGCMQVNLRWHGQAFSSVAQAFDPETNVAYAAGLLADEHSATGDWSTAAGRYHSYNPNLSVGYKRVVAQNRQRLPAGFATAAAYPSGFGLRTQTLSNTNWAHKAIPTDIGVPNVMAATTTNTLTINTAVNDAPDSLSSGNGTSGTGLLLAAQGPLIARNEKRPMYEGLFTALPATKGTGG